MKNICNTTHNLYDYDIWLCNTTHDLYDYNIWPCNTTHDLKMVLISLKQRFIQENKSLHTHLLYIHYTVTVITFWITQNDRYLNH